MRPDFEEKQFESAANGELRLQSPFMYPAGQVAEGILGFDVASLQPPTSPIWNILDILPPTGIRLVPNLWPIDNRPGPNVRLPSFVVSLILQYKRANYLTRWNASQWSHWHQEYYRYQIEDHQHNQLMQLESIVNNSLVVRYAGPVFHTYDELEQNLLHSTILQNTNFVSPNSIGSWHTAWTYIAPGGVGWANPEGNESRSETWSDIVEQLNRVTQPTTVLAHLREMASAFQEPAYFFEDRISRLPSSVMESPELKQGILDLITIGNYIGSCGSSWWLQVVPA